MTREPLKSGDRVRSKPGTLAYFCGDLVGTVERVEGNLIMVRMDRTQKTVPFRAETLEPQPSTQDGALLRK